MNDFKLGKASTRRLLTCHLDLQTFARAAIITTPVDFTVVCGNRGRVDQTSAYNHTPRRSNARFGESPHNYKVSYAEDIQPYVNGVLIGDVRHDAFQRLLEHLRQVEKELYDDGAITNHIENGYDLWGWDAPHWQLRGWKQLRPKLEVIDNDRF